MSDCKSESKDTVEIMWTGGLDSTLLLFKALKNGFNVRTLSFNSNTQLNSSLMDAHNRKLIKSKLEQLGYTFESREIDILSITGSWPTMYDKQEHALWLRMLPLYVEPWVREIQLGYLSEDPIMEHISDVQSEYKSGGYNRTTPLPKLTTPLDTYTKADVIGELKILAEEMNCDNIMHIVGTCCSMTRINSLVVNCGGCAKCKRSIEHGIIALNLPIPDTTLELIGVDKSELLPIIVGNVTYMGFHLNNSEHDFTLSITNKVRLRTAASIFVVVRVAESTDCIDAPVVTTENKIVNNKSLIKED